MNSEIRGPASKGPAPLCIPGRSDFSLEQALQSEDVLDLVFSYLRIESEQLQRAGLAAIRALEAVSVTNPPAGTGRSLEAWPPS